MVNDKIIQKFDFIPENYKIFLMLAHLYKRSICFQLNSFLTAKEKHGKMFKSQRTMCSLFITPYLTRSAVNA